MSMFDALKNLNLNDLGGLMQEAQKMRERLAARQAEIAAKTVTADAGGGMVQATVNGKMELVKVRIDKAKIDPADTDLLEDVILAAVNAAQGRAAEMMKEELKKVSAELGLPPGMMPGM